MRLLLAGMNSKDHGRTEFTIRAALNNFEGITLHVVDLEAYIREEGIMPANEFLYNERKKFAPDVVLYSGVEALETTIFSDYKEAQQIVWFYDAPFHVNVCKIGNFVNYLFITAHGLVDEYRYWGVNCHWLLEGVNDPPHRKINHVNGKLSADVGFAGAPDMRRNQLLGKICDEVECILKIWGPATGPPYFGLENYGWDVRLPYRGEMVPGIDYPLFCSSTKIVLGINVYNDIYQYFSNRNLFTMACGGFLLTHYVPGMEELFVNHHHLVWYHDFDECVELINYYLDNDEERNKIRNNAYILAHTEYSMERQLRKMFDICGIKI